jgi:hypothetical protein
MRVYARCRTSTVTHKCKEAKSSHHYIIVYYC